MVGLCLRRQGSGLGRGLAISSLLVAFGGPVSWLAFRFVPGMNVFRPYSRLLFVFDMGLAILGAVGLDAAMRWVSGSDSSDAETHAHAKTNRRQHSGRWWTARIAATLIVVGTALQLGLYGRHSNPPFLPARGNLTLRETP